MWFSSFLLYILITIKCYSSYLNNITNYVFNDTMLVNNNTKVKSSLQEVSFIMDWKDKREELYHPKGIYIMLSYTMIYVNST